MCEICLPLLLIRRLPLFTCLPVHLQGGSRGYCRQSQESAGQHRLERACVAGSFDAAHSYVVQLSGFRGGERAATWSGAAPPPARARRDSRRAEVAFALYHKRFILTAGVLIGALWAAAYGSEPFFILERRGYVVAPTTTQLNATP